MSTSLDETMSMLDEAYQTGQEALNEGRALLDEVSGNNSSDSIMGDETSHRKRGPDTELRSGGD